MDRYEWAKDITEALMPLSPSGRSVVWKAIQEIEKLAKKKSVEDFVNSLETKKYFEEIESEPGEDVRVITDRSLFFAADAFIEKL
jgi:hypothetical protein